MLYTEDSQTVAPGAALSFTANLLNSPSGSIALSGSDALTLAAGEYLVSFVSDASITEAGSIGAALALDGAALPYAASALASTGPDGDRIALTAIVDTTGGTLSVINNAGNSQSFENSTLTVVRLA